MSDTVRRVKYPYCSYRLLLNVRKMKDGGKNLPINIFDRAMVILPEFIGVTFKIYNGKTFVKMVATQNHVGHKFGEFSPTRVITKQTAQRLGLKVKK